MNISLLELFNFIFALLSTGAIGTVVGIWYKSKRHEEIISELDQRTRNVPTLEQNMVRVVDLEERVKILESMNGTLKSIEVSMIHIKEGLNEVKSGLSKLDDRFNNHIHHNPRM